MTPSPLVHDYLDELRSVAALRLTPGRSEELVDEIREHIDAAITSGQAPEDVIARLGRPDEIVGAETPSGEPKAVPRLRVREVLAIILLLIGAAAYGVGWVVGLILLLLSDRWSARDKLIGALVWPGGLGLFLATATFSGSVTEQTCDSTGACSEVITSGSTLAPWAGILLAILLIVPPIWTSVHLARTATVPPR